MYIRIDTCFQIWMQSFLEGCLNTVGNLKSHAIIKSYLIIIEENNGLNTVHKFETSSKHFTIINTAFESSYI